jgi:amidohydrolase
MGIRIGRALFVVLSICSILRPAAALDKKTASDIDREIEKSRAELIKIRRFIHMNPQLPGREGETARLVSGRLQALGLDVRTGVGRTGLVAVLRGIQPGAMIALRADMDADPIQELADVPYKSLNAGVMHASGHDLHTAIGLGTAIVLSALKDRIHGGVKFIFQPGDDNTPGEDGGAALLIKEGVLDNPPVVAVFGLRVCPETLGEAFLASGPFLASSDAFHVQVRGKPGPTQDGSDAVALAAQAILGLQTLFARLSDPADPIQLIIGKLEAGSKADTVAERVTFEGVVRTLSESSRKRIPRAMEAAVKGIAQGLGGDATFGFEQDIPPVYNHPELLDLMRSSFDEALGEKKLVEIKPQMTADDFGRYGQKVPSLFFFLGSRNPRLQPVVPLRSPYFNPDERTISIGIKVLSHLLINCLDQQNGADKSIR